MAAIAFGRPAERVLPGQKVFGELASGADATVLVDCVAGMRLSARCVAYKGTALHVDLAVADPDGAPVALGNLKKTNAKKSLVSITALPVSRTGSYRLTVSAINGTQGGFDLAISGAPAKTVSGTGSIDAPGGVAIVPFGALAGDTVRCTVRPAKKSKLKPILHQFVDAGGAAQTIDATRQTGPAAVTTLGTSSFTVTGDAGTTGAFTWSLNFVRAKAPKAARDVAELDAVGTISGVAVIDGQATRTAVERVGKSAGRTRAPDVLPGELVVSMPAAASFAEVETAAAASMPGARCTVVRALSAHGPYLVRIEHLTASRDARAKSATRALAKSAAAAGTFAWCEPNGVVNACGDPDDLLYPRQFNLRYLRLPQAWDKTTGDASIVIAIVDTGYVFHPDLITQWLPGWDFVSDSTNAEDGDGWDADPTDTAYALHGTHVAGIVGARTNNKNGVAGVVWHTKLLPVRVLGKNGGSFFDVAAGLLWSVGLPVPGVPTNANPARVVNMSLGAAYDAQVMREAVATVVLSTNAVLVAAAGNDGSSARFYPAAYTGVIPVYALDANLDWASYSNWGDWISVGAPGGDPYRGQAGILSTYFDTTTGKPSYSELSGTSMASPQVAGVAALMIAAKPTLTRIEIRDILEKTAVDLGLPGFDNDFGWGMVNADAAITYVLTPFAAPDSVEVAPTSLFIDGISNQARIFVRTKASVPVTISDITPTTDQYSGWLGVTADRMVTPATLDVLISPDLDTGAYTGKIRLTTSVGVVDVPVRVERTPHPKFSTVLVQAVTAEGTIVAQTSTTAAKNWAYSLAGVPIGRYRVRAYADLSGDLQINRVDEWEGLWPLRTQPDFLDVTAGSLDSDAINVPLERYDTRFDYDGVGGGAVSGAMAVRGYDVHTGRPVAGANVYVNGGSPQAVTDERGRAVIVGAFGGSQVVTVSAPGYGPTTRVGINAQYQAFPLESPVVVATLSTTATVRGLTPADHDVWVAVGDAVGHVVYDGVHDPAVNLTLTATDAAVPVSVVSYDASGVPMQHALYEVDTLAATIDVQLVPLIAGGAQARFALPSVPPSNFNAAGAAATSTTYLLWDDTSWVPVGNSPLVLGQERQGWFADPAVADQTTPMKFVAEASNPAGVSTRRVFFGTAGNLQIEPTAFTLDGPCGPTSPAAGAAGVATAPLMTWTLPSAGQLYKLVIEEVGTSWRWTIWTSASTSQLQLPAISVGALKAATTYRWSIATYRFAAGTFDSGSYREARLDTDPIAATFSGWSTFTTQ